MSITENEKTYREIAGRFSPSIERAMMARFKPETVPGTVPGTEETDPDGKVVEPEDLDSNDLSEAITAIGNVDFSDAEAADGGRLELVGAAIASLQKIVDRHRAAGVEVNGRVMLQFVR